MMMMMSFQPFQLVVQASGEMTLITAGLPGLAGANGIDGINGTNGTNGLGVPQGGTTGQALVKNSVLNNDTSWQNVPTIEVVIQDATTQTNSTWSSSKIQTQLNTKAATNHNHDAQYAPIASGIPVGGTTGQVLVKTSNADYADAWQTIATGGGTATNGIPTGGTVGQALIKSGGADFSAVWKSLISVVDEFDLGGITWSTGAPSTTAILKGRYVEMGSLVALSLRLDYGATAITNAFCTIPMNGYFPLALEFTGVDAANEIITAGLGVITTSETTINTTGSAFVCIRRNAANNGQEIFVRAPATAAYKFVSAMILYRKA
jgi:hypothetical protein